MGYAIHRTGSSLFPSRDGEIEKPLVDEKNAPCRFEAQFLRPSFLTIAKLHHRTAGMVLAWTRSGVVDAKLPLGGDDAESRPAAEISRDSISPNIVRRGCGHVEGNRLLSRARSLTRPDRLRELQRVRGDVSRSRRAKRCFEMPPCQHDHSKELTASRIRKRLHELRG